MAETDWISAAEAARRLGIKQATLYSYVSRGVLTRRRARQPRRRRAGAGSHGGGCGGGRGDWRRRGSRGGGTAACSIPGRSRSWPGGAGPAGRRAWPGWSSSRA